MHHSMLRAKEARPATRQLVADFAIVRLSAMAGLLYMSFIIVGITKCQGWDSSAYTTGCAVAYVAAIRSFRDRQD